MDQRVFQKVVALSERKKLEAMQYKYKRDFYYLVKTISPEFFCGITGMRGIGKTVLLTQLAAEEKDSLYIPLDISYLRPFDLYEIIETAYKQGFCTLFLDEVQVKSDWTWAIKTAYDEGIVRIFFTGSSKIDITKGADLSRRVLIIDMPPATFGEYLRIKRDINLPPISLAQIFQEDVKHLATKYILASDYFSEYLRVGGVLYPGKETEVFLQLRRAVDRAITYDLSILKEIDANYHELAYRFLYLIATSPPLQLSYSSIANTLDVSTNTVRSLAKYLERVGLTYVVLPCAKGKSLVRKEPKITLPIPLRSYFNWELGKEPSIGALREDFFVQHLSPICYLKGKRGEKTADFLIKVNSKEYIVEVGGVTKSRYQSPDFIAIDGFPLKPYHIPLWLFGFAKCSHL